MQLCQAKSRTSRTREISMRVKQWLVLVYRIPI